MVEQVDIERVLTELRKVAATASNEEEFKINAERVLYNEVISKLGRTRAPNRCTKIFVR